MSNLVKIREVMLYVGYTASALQSYQLKQRLTDAGIKFTLMNYADDSAHEGLFSALSTWSWGLPPNQVQKKFTDFPIVTWKEFYDDWSSATFCATSLAEFESSSLLKNKDKIE